jgi:hypothetical protein
LDPIDEKGFLKDIKDNDKNENNINDFLEIKSEGGPGKAYATYQIKATDFLEKSATNFLGSDMTFFSLHERGISPILTVRSSLSISSKSG